jgi:cytochrome c oxidase assembly protein subunit 15
LTGYANLHRFIIFTTLCTFALLIAGGLVTSTQSGLSVPDWPTTYGHFMFAYPLDQMVGGIFYEHSHRMIASVVGFLTVIAAFWLWKREDRPWVKYLGLAALGTVLLQGLLGGLTVIFLLPTAISAAHATLAQSFFSIMVILAVVTSAWWRTDMPAPNETARFSLGGLTLWTTITIYLQLILGAVMRHMNAGLAVPTFPLSYGQLFPSLSADAIAQYNQQLIQSDLRLAADDPVTAGQIVIHLAHRYWAVIVALSVIVTAIAALKQRRHFRRGAQIGLALLLLLLVQGTLGALTVLSAKAVDITTAHVATGAALLGASLFLHLHAKKTFGFRRASPRQPLRAAIGEAGI